MINNSTADIDEIYDEKFKRIIDGAHWFYWIAGLSIINSTITFFDGEWSFLFSLGMTQFVDMLGYALADEYGITAKIIAVCVNLLMAGVFAAFGYLASRPRKLGFIFGMILYSLDALIPLLFGDFMSAGFHVIAIVFIFRGYGAYNDLMEKNQQYRIKQELNEKSSLVPVGVFTAGLIFFGVIATATYSFTSFEEVEIVPGGLYSTYMSNDSFGVIKVLKHEEKVSHVRVYSNTFSEFPEDVNENILILNSVDNVEGGNPGIGHLPVTDDVFRSWEPVYIKTVEINDDELAVYEEYRKAGGRPFDMSDYEENK